MTSFVPDGRSLDDYRRPSPDAPATAAEREVRGKLKIFLGAAPGVGKTYAMLAAGRRRAKAEGIDVVVGWSRLTDGPKPRRSSSASRSCRAGRSTTKGAPCRRWTSTILRRRPALVLVDELAHTNAEGSRHPKRYLDVEELLAPASTSTRR